MKKLKIWNGRGWGHRHYDKEGRIVPDPTGKKYCNHAYVCANSRAHAVRIINEAAGYNVVNDNELKEYWSENCWGRPMDNVCPEDNPEIGVWTRQNYNDIPKRIYPIGDEETNDKKTKKKT